MSTQQVSMSFFFFQNKSANEYEEGLKDGRSRVHMYVISTQLEEIDNVRKYFHPIRVGSNFGNLLEIELREVQNSSR